MPHKDNIEEILRLASLVGTDAKNPEDNLINKINEILAEQSTLHQREMEEIKNLTHTITPSMNSENYSDSVTELECFQDGFDDACGLIRDFINSKLTK